jgi:hypothetical protein
MIKWAVLLGIAFSQLNGSILEPSKPFTNSTNIDFKELKREINFNVLLPRNHGYKMEIKEPYPLVAGQSISRIRLHYFDQTGRKYIFGIEEHKATDYKIEREETNIDVRNQSSSTRSVIEDFRFNLRGEKVNINGIEGRFEPWADHSSGGYLRFVQEDTYIEIDSGELSRQMMIDLARTMISLN